MANSTIKANPDGRTGPNYRKSLAFRNNAKWIFFRLLHFVKLSIVA